MNKIDSHLASQFWTATVKLSIIITYNKKIGINSNSVINFELNNKEMSHFLIMKFQHLILNNKK